MKRSELIQKLLDMGCILARHGGKHDWYTNPRLKMSQTAPLARTEYSGSKTSADIKRLLSLSKEEHERILEAAASAAVADYGSSEVNLGESVDDIKEYL